MAPLAVAASFLAAAPLPAPAATVWTGYGTNFAKPDGVNSLLPQWQDPITANVSLTRLNDGGGLINPVAETVYDKPSSPAGTMWAFPYNNPTQIVASANWMNLSFLPWAAAFGANGAGGPPSTLGQPSVVFLIDDDLYVDVRLTGWTVRAGGGFSYQRAAGPGPGDFNADGVVDGDDLAVWEEKFPASGGLQSDGHDVLTWQRRFVENSSPANPTTARVPEPTSAVAEPASPTLLGAGLVGLAIRRKKGARRRQS